MCCAFQGKLASEVSSSIKKHHAGCNRIGNSTKLFVRKMKFCQMFCCTNCRFSQSVFVNEVSHECAAFTYSGPMTAIATVLRWQGCEIESEHFSFVWFRFIGYNMKAHGGVCERKRIVSAQLRWATPMQELQLFRSSQITPLSNGGLRQISAEQKNPNKAHRVKTLSPECQ